MKILYLSPYYWPEEIGSAPYATGLAEFLASKGDSVTTVAFRPHYPSIEPYSAWQEGNLDNEIHESVSIIRVPVNERGSGGFKTRLKNDLRFFFSISKMTLQRKFKGTDVVVAYVPSIFSLFASKLVQLMTGAPIIAIVHDIESGLAHSLRITKSKTVLSIMRLIERIGLNWAHTVVVLTKGMREELENIGCRRPIEIVSIWGNSGSVTSIDPHRIPVLTYSGNFGKKQNIDQLFPLIEHLDEIESPAKIILRGDGSERTRIENEVKNRKLGNVEFADLVPANQFIATLQEANIHLVPQATNVANYALPSKLFSIMSAGRPFVCIAKESSPLDELAKESGAGICIDPSDHEGLKVEVTALLSDPGKQQEMGHRGQSFIRNQMNREDILNRLEGLIRETAASKV